MTAFVVCCHERLQRTDTCPTCGRRPVDWFPPDLSTDTVDPWWVLDQRLQNDGRTYRHVLQVMADYNTLCWVEEFKAIERILGRAD